MAGIRDAAGTVFIHNINENKIKLYLWNHRDKPVCFDDFELTQYK